MGLLVVGGCGSGPAPVRLTVADQGRVVALAMGRRAVVKLNSLWASQPISGRAVRAVALPQLTFAKKGCPSLVGCGTVALTVEAVARGRSVIVARRGICGELFRCPPSERLFALTVVVR